MLLTFQNVDGRAVVSLLDDAAALCQCSGIHAVHDGEDLTDLQVLHEIILQKSLLDQLSRPGMGLNRTCCFSNSLKLYLMHPVSNSFLALAVVGEGDVGELIWIKPCGFS